MPEVKFLSADCYFARAYGEAWNPLLASYPFPQEVKEAEQIVRGIIKITPQVWAPVLSIRAVMEEKGGDIHCALNALSDDEIKVVENCRTFAVGDEVLVARQINSNPLLQTHFMIKSYSDSLIRPYGQSGETFATKLACLLAQVDGITKNITSMQVMGVSDYFKQFMQRGGVFDVPAHIGAVFDEARAPHHPRKRRDFKTKNIYYLSHLLAQPVGAN